MGFECPAFLVPLRWKTYTYIDCPPEELEELLRLLDNMQGAALDMLKEWIDETE